MRAELVLYSTWGCHLCEQAEQLLLQADLTQPFKVVDIVEDEQAFERYRVMIPVLRSGDNELCWPFDAAQLVTWLKEVS
ncbi:glutaredoxin family protein [Rheinheimera baltica]|uniref:Glutaredoxin family protein n=1 Tax=Rheinheimera baltica TaxID=67576 RepID=A0ABT9I1V4_9GAMM|nr:glutaredoxin family protein [Rheinheimera baltica]MDP5137367.1 glutaredoxin family protein [Rheinheimera baltica]MDP5143421.1 glutaredoxin family protein [Rheinheimera baltica]MDP5149285.1 glutaredoxin family protein [Rheinheimera baltica]MDP5191632.1 glutaredoxin family protein [Rheinheimera baltica]